MITLGAGQTKHTGKQSYRPGKVNVTAPGVTAFLGCSGAGVTLAAGLDVVDLGADTALPRSILIGELLLVVDDALAETGATIGTGLGAMAG